MCNVSAVYMLCALKKPNQSTTEMWLCCCRCVVFFFSCSAFLFAVNQLLNWNASNRDIVGPRKNHIKSFMVVFCYSFNFALFFLFGVDTFDSIKRWFSVANRICECMVSVWIFFGDLWAVDEISAHYHHCGQFILCLPLKTLPNVWYIDVRTCEIFV